MRRYENWLLLCLTLAVLAISGISPADRLTWLMEALPVIVALPVLAYLNVRQRFTRVLAWLLFIAATLILIGAHYTYARVPVGYWVQEAFGLERNHYDRWGHTFLGVVVAILAREMFMRYSPLKQGGWLFAVCTFAAVTVGALYEFVEWWAALIMGEQNAQEFLAMQGDQWDTQWDMFLATSGAIIAQLVFWRVHNRQMREVAMIAPRRRVIRARALRPVLSPPQPPV
jgi:putative membrane protein